MTTGSYTIDHTLHSPTDLVGVGRYEFKSWSGANRDVLHGSKSPRVKLRTPVPQRDGSVKYITVRVPGDRPPKRARNQPHAYSMEYLHRLEASVYQDTNAQNYASTILINRGAWSAEVLLDNNDQIKLVNKLREKLQGSDFNATVFVAEFGESMRMIGDTAIRFAKVFHHLRRRDLLGASRALFEGASRAPLKRHDWRTMKPGVATIKRTAEWWLEVQYGWRPLIDDVSSAAQAVAHAVNVPLRQTYRTSVKKEIDLLVEVDYPGNYGGSRVGYKSHRRGLIAQISEKPGLLAQLGLLNPLSVVWELLPYSFVIDWFIPIGQWIEARGSASSLEGLFITSDKLYAESGPLQGSHGVQSASADDDTWKHIRFTRTISASLNVPLPNFKPLKKALGWEHCANGIALLVAGSNPYRK